MADDPATRVRENATEIAGTVVTGIWLAALVSGAGWWLGAMLFGYLVVVPLVALVFGDEADRAEWWDDSWSEWWHWDDRDDVESETKAESERNQNRHDASRPGRQRDNRDALETLRDRYARGELTDDQFERKLERLLETETIEDADEWARERLRGEEARERYDRERRRGDDREPEFET